MARFLNLAKICNLDSSRLAGLYTQLSQDIHGDPWSGPAVLARLGQIKGEEERCLVRAMVADMGLRLENADE